MYSETVEISTLKNRLQVVSDYVPGVHSVSLGMFVGVGARYERPSEAGLTHFLEHMLFKGTGKRTARQIAVEIESRGGMLNAYTDKEHTCYYARGLAEDLEVIMDVLADMVRNASLKPEDVELEKRVVLEEIKRANDNPEDAVHELLDRTAWKGHPLGRSTLGTARTVSSLTAEKLRSFMAEHYEPGSITVAAAGKVRHRSLVRLADRYFGDMEPVAHRRRDRTPQVRPSFTRRRRRCEQVLFSIGMPAYGYGDRRKYGLTVLDMVLGGTMGSRLFQEIREKRGLAYDIGSSTVGFRDTGLFTVSGGTSPDRFDEVLTLTGEQLERVRQEGITDEELLQARRRLRGVLLIGRDNITVRMMGLGRSLQALGRVPSFAEIMEEVEAITNDMLVTIAREVFAPEKQVIVALGPFGKNGGGV